jgi:hypothetical protein
LSYSSELGYRLLAVYLVSLGLSTRYKKIFIRVFDWTVDFRSPDGLYAAIKDGTLDIPGPIPRVITEGTPITGPGTSKARPKRSAADRGEVSRRESQAGSTRFELVDPQELMNIQVFRDHPEVF